MNIEQTVSTALSGLALGPSFTFDHLLEAVQDHRRRRLRVVELASLDACDGLCAVWLMTDSEDLVLHAHSDSALHRQQFVLHEVAHILLGHCELGECSDDALLPNIPPRTRGRLLARQDLDSETEIAAESLADRLAAGIRGSAFAESRFVEVFG